MIHGREKKILYRLSPRRAHSQEEFYMKSRVIIFEHFLYNARIFGMTSSAFNQYRSLFFVAIAVKIFAKRGAARLK